MSGIIRLLYIFEIGYFDYFQGSLSLQTYQVTLNTYHITWKIRPEKIGKPKTKTSRRQKRRNVKPKVTNLANAKLPKSGGHVKRTICQ